jgi:hypothetical protein
VAVGLGQQAVFMSSGGIVGFKVVEPGVFRSNKQKT